MIIIFFIICVIILFGIFTNQINLNRIAKANLYFHLKTLINKEELVNKFESILDQEANLKDVIEQINVNEKEFNDYLRFFEELNIMQIPIVFNTRQAELIFGKHAELMTRHRFVRDYINQNGYTELAKALAIQHR